MPRSLLVLLGAALGLPLSAGAASLPTYQLEMRDGHFTPASLKVPAGQRFKIVLANFAGYRAMPSLATVAALAGYWLLVAFWLRRTSPVVSPCVN